jgi:hypothetical protein
MSGGYKSVQSCHSIADFASEYPGQFKFWKGNSNSIICLSVENEDELKRMYGKWKDITPSVIFWEPDVDAFTSVCLLGSPDVRKRIKHLPLLK